MKEAISPLRVSNQVEAAEVRRNAREWEKMLISRARSFDGLGFRKLVDSLIKAGKEDPDFREVAHQVVTNVAILVPEIRITLKAIVLDEIRNGTLISKDKRR